MMPETALILEDGEALELVCEKVQALVLAGVIYPCESPDCQLGDGPIYHIAEGHTWDEVMDAR